IGLRSAAEQLERSFEVAAPGSGGAALHRVGRELKLDPVALEQEPRAPRRGRQIRELPRHAIDLDDDTARRLAGPPDLALPPPPRGLAPPAQPLERCAPPVEAVGRRPAVAAVALDLVEVPEVRKDPLVVPAGLAKPERLLGR